MEEFAIKGNDAFLKIAFDKVYGFPDETCHWGGYDTKTIIEINSGSFSVEATMYLSTGEIFDFYNRLLKAK
jgi:hypothetical protein